MTKQVTKLNEEFDKKIKKVDSQYKDTFDQQKLDLKRQIGTIREDIDSCNINMDNAMREINQDHSFIERIVKLEVGHDTFKEDLSKFKDK